MPPLSNRDRISNPLRTPQLMSWWRTFPAHAFGSKSRLRLAEALNRLSSTNSIWRGALRGDAAAALHVVLRTRPAKTITARTDLMMTVLLCCALEGSAGAALVMSHALRQLPLEDRICARRLGASWLAHNLASALSQKLQHKGNKKCASRTRDHNREGCLVAAPDAEGLS
jgi:hypothetical protein